MVKVLILKRVSMLIACFVLGKYIKKSFGNFSGNLNTHESIPKLVEDYFKKAGEDIIDRSGKQKMFF